MDRGVMPRQAETFLTLLNVNLTLMHQVLAYPSWSTCTARASSSGSTQPYVRADTQGTQVLAEEWGIEVFVLLGFADALILWCSFIMSSSTWGCGIMGWYHALGLCCVLSTLQSRIVLAPATNAGLGQKGPMTCHMGQVMLGSTGIAWHHYRGSSLNFLDDKRLVKLWVVSGISSVGWRCNPGSEETWVSFTSTSVPTGDMMAPVTKWAGFNELSWMGSYTTKEECGMKI